MHVKKFSLYLAGIFLIQSVYCQNIDNINRTLQDFSSEIHFRNSGKSESHANIDGSEYLDENFVNGEIVTPQSEHYLGIPMRYNILQDKMEVKLTDGNIYDLSDHTKILKVLLKDKTAIYTEYDAGKMKKSGYLFILYQGKSTLYFRYLKEFVKAVEETNGIVPAVPAKIVDKSGQYYVKLADGIPQIVDSKKDFLILLNNHAKEMEDLLKKEKLKTNNEEDLIKAITYYDSL
jgi:hypothetical protein